MAKYIVKQVGHRGVDKVMTGEDDIETAREVMCDYQHKHPGYSFYIDYTPAALKEFAKLPRQKPGRHYNNRNAGGLTISFSRSADDRARANSAIKAAARRRA